MHTKVAARLGKMLSGVGTSKSFVDNKKNPASAFSMKLRKAATRSAEKGPFQAMAKKVK